MSETASPPTPFVGSEFPAADFERLRELLLARRGFDLAMYKDRCVKRRIAARVRACGFQSAPPYLEQLESDEQELDALLAAITINVSQFFRNPSTYRTLERQVLPELLGRARAAGERRLRFWSVGCAGGEEPYSLALLVAEQACAEVDVEIWGSDLSAPAIAQAVAGYYDEPRLAELPRALRTKYFLPEGRGYRLCEAIRRRVRFDQRDILGEATYPRAALILCRNVLIYFSRADQERILQRFAEALEPGGYLVLGRAETLLGSIRQQFVAVYPEERIFRHIATP